MDRTEIPNNKNLYSVVAIIVFVPVLFFETTLSMVQVWIENETFTHGFLIFPIAVYLIWLKREHLQLQQAQAQPLMLPLFLLVLALWLASYAVDIKAVQQISIILTIPILVWSLLGYQVFTAVLFPILLLFFSIPLGQGLIPPMMELTAHFVVNMIKLTGIPVYQDGLFFVLPTGQWNVAEECSGVRYLIASLALGTIYAYINYQSVSKRIIFILFSAFIPIVANILRAFGIVMVGHFSGMELATGVDHIVYGWVFFGVVIFIMFYIGSFWWDESDTPVMSNSGPGGKPASSRLTSYFSLSVFVLLVIVSTKLIAYSITQAPSVSAQPISLPEQFSQWETDPGAAGAWMPDTVPSDSQLQRTYRRERDLVQLNIAYYAYQRQDAEAVTSQNRLTNPYSGEWKVTFSAAHTVGDNSVNETELRLGSDKLLVWQWYQMGQHPTASPYLAKALEVYNLIIANRPDASYITIATELKSDKEQSRQRLHDFLLASGETIRQQLNSMYRTP